MIGFDKDSISIQGCRCGPAGMDLQRPPGRDTGLQTLNSMALHLKPANWDYSSNLVWARERAI